MRRVLAMLGGLLLSVSAMAATLSYTPPTTYTDGSPLPAADILGYEFRCGAGTSAGVSCTPLTLPGTATGGTMVITGPAAGFTACVEGATRVAAGLGPYSSPPACKTFAAIPPNPPGNVTIAVVIGINMAPVFKLTSTGKRSPEAAGFVAVDTPCKGNVLFYYRGDGYRKVDPFYVRWWGDIVPSDNVAAPCAAT